MMLVHLRALDMMTLRQSNQSFLAQVPCFIIHKRPYREHDFLLDILTLSNGRISAVARFGKRGALKNAGLLQPFIPLTMNLVKNYSSLWNVGAVNPHGKPFDFGLPNIFCAQYINELLYNLCHEEEGNSQLFASYLETLSLLEKNTDVKLSLRQFESVLLYILGYAPNFADAFGNRFDESLFYSFDPQNGFKVCFDKSLERFSGKVLLNIAEGNCSGANELRVLQKVHSRLFKMLMNYKPLHSHELYSQYLSMQEI